MRCSARFGFWPRLRQHQRSVRRLGRLIELGFKSCDALRQDRDLGGLRQHQRDQLVLGQSLRRFAIYAPIASGDPARVKRPWNPAPTSEKRGELSNYIETAL